MIHLRNPGPIKPAPVLEGIGEQMRIEVQGWPRIISVTHWLLGDPSAIEGAEFHVVNGGELGHIHKSGEVHLRLTEPLRNLLISLDLAKPLIWDSAWVTWTLKTTDDLGHATWLFKLGYDRLISSPDEELVRRIQANSRLPAESTGSSRTSKSHGRPRR